MKISDEIREWCDVHCGEECGEYLGLLADRIDRELIELPRDADGVPIHVGDTVYLESGSKADVKSIEFSQGEHSIVFTVRGKGFLPSPKYLSHERPDSLNRIADELDEQAGSLTKDGYRWQEDAIHDFADRIRKLAEKEEE